MGHLSCWPDPGINDSDGRRLPARNMGWPDAVNYVVWLARFTGRNYRHLTEAEWEYCCRAGDLGPCSLVGLAGPVNSDYVNFDGRLTFERAPKSHFRGHVTPVGEFPPNAFGLYDMHGNVWEWVKDQWHENYRGAPLDGSAWINDRQCDDRVVRGGSYRSGARYIRSASRGRPTSNPSDLLKVGLRVARSLW